MNIIKKIIAWICILNGIGLYAILAYFSTKPGFYVNNIFFLLALYIIPILIGIGILKNSKLALIFAALLFVFQFTAYYNSIGFEMPIRIAFSSHNEGNVLNIDVTAIVFFLLTLLAIFKSSSNSSLGNIE
tara:strand:+ start:2377 stop:2766 length:390 start_codon:yes stop_codon:yes gene_type:complete